MTGYHEFSRYLLEIEDIPEKRIRYYVRWVQRFYQFKIITPNSTTHLEEFLESLSQSSPSWMVRQAEHAVRLYMIFTHNTVNANGGLEKASPVTRRNESYRKTSPWKKSNSNISNTFDFAAYLFGPKSPTKDGFPDFG